MYGHLRDFHGLELDVRRRRRGGLRVQGGLRAAADLWVERGGENDRRGGRTSTVKWSRWDGGGD